MIRITEKDLQAVCDRINRITNSPHARYMKDESGKYHAQIGNYHISYAYGGVCLHQMCNEGGGVTDVFYCGHIPKRDLYYRMQAFITGYCAADAH